MNPPIFIPLAIKASILLIVFGIGLEAHYQDAFSLFKKPGLLFRSLLSMNVVLPVAVVAMAAFFSLYPALEIALVTLALSPVPPILPKSQLRVGGRSQYVIGLLVTTSLFSVFFIPIILGILGKVFSKSLHVSPLIVMKSVSFSILLPLAAGLFVRELSPSFAKKTFKLVLIFGALLLAAGLLPAYYLAWPWIVSLIGNGTLLAMSAFVALGLLLGHILGGPIPQDRSALALSTACRHPGIALAIATANFPDQRQSVLAALLLYLIVTMVITLPYVTWVRRRKN